MTFSPAGYPVYLHFVDSYMTFSSASHYTSHFLMTSSSLSPPQAIPPLVFRGLPHDFLSHESPRHPDSITPAKSFPSPGHPPLTFLYSLLTNTLMGYILSPESLYPHRVLIQIIHSHQKGDSYLCPIVIVIKTRQLPIFPQTQCHVIPHPINHRSVPAAV